MNVISKNNIKVIEKMFKVESIVCVRRWAFV